jgi:hypothetical protein
MSPLPTLAHAIAKGSTFSISSRFDVAKLQQNGFDVSSTGSFWFPMSMDTHIHIPYHPYCNGDPTLPFFIPKTIVSTLLSMIIFTGCPLPPSPFTGARGAHKWQQGYIYSYHRLQNSYQLFRKPCFDTNVVLLFIHVTPSTPRPYCC